MLPNITARFALGTSDNDTRVSERDSSAELEPRPGVQVRYCSSTVLFKEDIKQEYPQKSSDMATKEAAVRAVSSARGAIGISKVWTPYQS